MSRLLLLDEATSNLNSVTRKAIQEMLENMRENEMIVIVIYRSVMVQNTDMDPVIKSRRVLKEVLSKEEEVMIK